MKQLTKGWIGFGLCVLGAISLTFARCATAAPTTNLAVTCETALDDGTPRKVAGIDSCKRVVYKTASQSTLIRALADDTWRRRSTLTDSQQTQVCKTAIEPGTVSDPSSGAPCVDWASVTVASLGPSAPINATGNLKLEWIAVSDCTDSSGAAPVTKPCDQFENGALKGYNVYSGIDPKNLTLLRSVGPEITSLDLFGYGNGTYYFGIEAFNAFSPGLRSDSYAAQVQKPVPTINPIPGVVQWIKITVTYE